MSAGLAPLYAATVARPLAPLSSRPARLGYTSVAWADREDLVAAVSGCGSVSVFHADAPGEVTSLVASRRSPARHIAWRPAGPRPPLLAVVDAVARLTLWASPDRRVNAWTTAAVVEFGAPVAAIGWTRDGSALAAVLVTGALAMYAVPDIPVLATPRVRPARAYQQALQNTTYRAGGLRELQPRITPSSDFIFGGPVRVASITPGSIDPSSVTIITVLVANPHVLLVCHVAITNPNNVQTAAAAADTAAIPKSEDANAFASIPGYTPIPSNIRTFEFRSLHGAQLDPERDGNCVACVTAPRKASIYAVGDKGVLSRWFFERQGPSAQGRWSRHATVRIDEPFQSENVSQHSGSCVVPASAWSLNWNAFVPHNGLDKPLSSNLSGNIDVCHDSSSIALASDGSAAAHHNKSLSGSADNCNLQGNGSQDGDVSCMRSPGNLASSVGATVAVPHANGVRTEPALNTGSNTINGGSNNIGLIDKNPRALFAPTRSSSASSKVSNEEESDGFLAARGMELVSQLKQSARKKVYSLAVSMTGFVLVTADAFGLTLRNGDTLAIIARQELLTEDRQQLRNYWGLCLSPNASAIMALDGNGRMDATAIVSTRTSAGNELAEDADLKARALLDTTSSNGLRGGWDLLACIASEGKEKASHVVSALTRITIPPAQSTPAVLEKIENIRLIVLSATDANTASIFAARRLLDNAIRAIGQSAPRAVISLLTVSTKDSLRVLTSNDLSTQISVVVSASQGCATSHLAAVPLADWVVGLCIICLRRYAMIALRNPTFRTLVGDLWAAVVAEDIASGSSADQTCIVSDRKLFDRLRPAAIGAAALLAVNEVHAESDKTPRYIRFSREQTANIVAAVLDVTVAWSTSSDGADNAVSGRTTVTAAGVQQNHKSRSAAIATALARHSIVASFIKNNSLVTITAMERALGLRGSSVGSGFLLTCARRGVLGKGRRSFSGIRNTESNSVPADRGDSNAAEVGPSENHTSSTSQVGTGAATGDSLPSGGDSRNKNVRGSGNKVEINKSQQKSNSATSAMCGASQYTEWSPFDLVTGRSLPPWAPLRRCVISGLVAAEITESLPDGKPAPNPVASWACRWAHESPFGGRWALVPSLDLDRYELSPTVPFVSQAVASVQTAQNVSDHSQTVRNYQPSGRGSSVSRQSAVPTTSGNNSSNYVIPQPNVAGASGGRNGSSAASGTSGVNGNVFIANNYPGAGLPPTQSLSLTAATTASSATNFCDGSTPGGLHIVDAGAAGPSTTPGLSQSPRVFVGDSSSMVQPVVGTPRGVMSTASSTTDPASTTSRGRKRGATTSRRGGRKRQASDARTSTPSQMSDQNVSQGPSGLGSSGALNASPSTGIGLGPGTAPAMHPSGIMQDVTSTDTRSTRTAATNISGGVDQVVGKPGRKPRGKRSMSSQPDAPVSQVPQSTQSSQQFQLMQDQQRSQASLQQQHMQPQQMQQHQNTQQLVQNIALRNTVPQVAQQPYVGHAQGHGARAPGQMNMNHTDSRANAPALGFSGSGQSGINMSSQVGMDAGLSGNFLGNAPNSGISLGDMNSTFGFLGGANGPSVSSNAAGASSIIPAAAPQRLVNNSGNLGGVHDVNGMQLPVGTGAMGSNPNFMGQSAVPGTISSNMNNMGGSQNQLMQGSSNNSFPQPTNTASGQLGHFPNADLAEIEAHLAKIASQLTPQQSHAAYEAFSRRAAFQQGNIAQMQSSTASGLNQSSSSSHLLQQQPNGAQGALAFSALSQNVSFSQGQNQMLQAPGPAQSHDGQQFSHSMQQQPFSGSSNFSDANVLSAAGDPNYANGVIKSDLGKSGSIMHQGSTPNVAVGNNMLPVNGSMVNGNLAAPTGVPSGGSESGNLLGTIGARVNPGNNASGSVPPAGAMHGNYPDTGRGGMVIGTNAHGVNKPRVSGGMPRVPAGSGVNAGMGTGERIWRGDLQITAERSNLLVTCVATRHTVSGRNPIRGAESWPSRIKCDGTKLKLNSDVQRFATDPTTQWYVRFSCVDKNGNEVEDQQLSLMMRRMFEGKCAFEIDCDASQVAPGKLYLFVMPSPNTGISLIGIFTPTPASTAESISIMNSLLGGS